MARQTLTKSTAQGNFPTLQPAANSLDLIMTAADATNKEQFVASGKDLIIFHNTGVSTRAVTFTSVVDPKNNRPGDVTAYSIGAGKYGHFGPLTREGWMQTDGYIYSEASHADVKFGVITLPQ
jgi:hypothetical protein